MSNFIPLQIRELTWAVSPENILESPAETTGGQDCQKVYIIV